MITSQLTFPLYRICTTMFGGRPVLVPPTACLQFNLAAIAGAIGADTRLIFLCTPNNPTGTICPRAEIESFLQAVPDHVVIVFDESYRDFADDPQYPDPVEYIAAGLNVLVIRSFSKGAGLANLRVGYALGRPELIDYLRRAQPPFNTGAPALAAANASLDDAEYQARSRCLVAQERQHLYGVLDALGVAYMQSQANFVLLTGLPIPGTTLAERLLLRGVIVRAMDGWGLSHAVRVTLGLREHNERFAAALRAELSLATSETGTGAPALMAGAGSPSRSIPEKP
jgi:histidinol-phosphate aminotransferase